MTSTPIQKKGEWFYPLKSLSTWLEVKVTLSPNKELHVNYTPLSIMAGDSTGWYWVRRDNGIVYTAIGSQLPHTIGWSNVRAYQNYDMSVTKLGAQGNVILNVTHNHGEPSLATDIYSLVIQDGKLSRQTAEMYYGFHNMKGIEKSKEGYYALLNHSVLLFLDRKANVVFSYDMASHLGSEKSFTVEYASTEEGIAIVRPYTSATLLLVDLKKGKAVQLYKEHLSKEEQKVLEASPKDGR